MTYVHNDFLKYDLPKNGASEIIRKLTEAKNPPTDIFLVMQKEAAKKYCGRPFQKYEGLRASILKPQYEMQILHKFAPTDFTPIPDAGAVTAFAANQRDEVRDLHDVAGADGCGGRVMECSEDISGTLRAQEHGHQPLVFENHGIDARYTGPHKVAPTLSARAGTGGNNLSLVMQEEEPVFCITGNAIDRQPENGGNGLGVQEDIAYTLTLPASAATGSGRAAWPPPRAPASRRRQPI